MAIFSMLKNQEKNIFLMNFEGLSVYALEMEKLVRIAKFSDEDSGYDEFRDFLSIRDNTPVTILVDSVAEEFIVEKTPHVGPLDRRSFLNRKSDQHFRGTEYRSAKILDREDSGRRDDRVLFSAITKNQAIDPWIKVLLDAEVPIKGVTTPAYALCKIANEFGLLTSDAILLVNWEISGIRQSLIVGDKMMFSRLTPLPNDPNADLAAAIVESCNQSKDYLERVGLLAFEQKLDVHVITPQLDSSDFAGKETNLNFREIIHHNSIDMMDIEKFSGAQRTITAILLCLDWGVRMGEFKNIYAPPSVLRFQKLHTARNLIGLLCLTMVLIGGLVSAPLFLDSLNSGARVETIRQEIGPIQSLYDGLTAQFPETPIPSEAMELAVRNYELIQSQLHSPNELLYAISEVVAMQPDIQLTTLEWKLVPLDDELSLSEAILEDQTLVNVDLQGALIGASSFRDSDRALREFIVDLSEIDGVTVEPISLPIESRSDTEVSARISSEVFDANFSIRIKAET